MTNFYWFQLHAVTVTTQKDTDFIFFRLLYSITFRKHMSSYRQILVHNKGVV